MKKTPERIESLAAEYVLGSLHGGARKRFERWMMESTQVRQEVWFWEQRLGQLSAEVASIEPPRSVWATIERRLWPEHNEAANDESAAGVRWLWPSWSLAATAAAVLFAVLLVNQPQPTAQSPLSGAIVQANLTDPLWLISESGDSNLLKLRSIAASAADSGKDYELWVVPADGQPISLGVLPVTDVHEVALTEQARAALVESKTLAISLEPSGGSRTGAPTGPILHVTKMYEL